jgi:hypothetical protein
MSLFTNFRMTITMRICFSISDLIAGTMRLTMPIG